MPPAFDPELELSLIAALCAGDPRAREVLGERLSCVPRMLAARNRQFGSPLSAGELDDVAQDVYMTVVARAKDYLPFAPLESWIHGICCRQLQNALRARRRNRGRTRELPDAVPDAARSWLDVLADAAEVQALLEKIGGLEADIVRMKHLDGLTFEDIGRVLRLSPNTVKARYYRGLDVLRVKLGIRLDPEERR